MGEDPRPMWDEAHEWKNTDWRERAETAERLLVAVRDLRDVYEVNARTVDGVAARNFFELFAEELTSALDSQEAASVPPEVSALPQEEM